MVDTSLAIKAMQVAYEEPSIHQVFCVKDTDYVPVFEHLSRKGIQFSIMHTEAYYKLPKDFRKYYELGQVAVIPNQQLAAAALEILVGDFMGSRSASLPYTGRNADIYALISKVRWDEAWEVHAKQRRSTVCGVFLRTRIGGVCGATRGTERRG